MALYFDERQLPKCHDRLDKSAEALYHCRNAKDAQTFNRYWTAFLIHSGSVINAVEAGANQTPQGRQWYGAKKRFARSDELIRYMYQARNAEEHGIEPVLTERPFLPFAVRDDETGEIDFDMGVDWGMGEVQEDGSMSYRRDPHYKPNPNGKIIIGASPQGPRLRPVYDTRFKETFWLPTQHMGKRICDVSPIKVGDLFMVYLQSLVSDAASVAS